MTGFRKIFRRLRTLMWTALTLLSILAAILVGIGKLLMPYSEKYQPQLEAWLSREFKQPVVVDSFTGEWKAFGPRISFKGVTLMGDGEGTGEIAIQQAALDIKPLNLLLPGQPLYTFRIIGADLSLIRTPEGRYELSGLGVSGRGPKDPDSQGFSNLARVGEVRLEDSSLSFDDAERNIHLQLSGMQGRLQINGNELATALEASITDPTRQRVLGDLKATALITLDDEQRLSDAQWHIKTGELMISELAQQLPPHALVPLSGWLNAEIWGEWSESRDQLMEGVIDLRESTLSEQPQVLELDHLNTRFRWNFHNRKNWRIDLSDLEVVQADKHWLTKHMSIERNIPGNIGIWVSSDFLDIEFPLQLTQRIMSSYGTRWPKQMPLQSRGELHDFDLVLDSRWKLYQASGDMRKIDAWDWGKYPDVAGIQGRVELLEGEGEVEFSGTGVRMNWPRNFRREAIVDIPGCRMEILWGQAWRIDARDCLIQNENFSISGRSRFAGNTGKPEMDINIRFSRLDLPALDDYWPQSVMSQKVIDWLSKGIVAGQAAEGRFSLRGDMDEWPFTGHEGELLAVADIRQARLNYLDGWPEAAEADLSLAFRGTRMQALGSVGDLGGVPVQTATALIENFKQPVLKMSYESQAPLPDLVRFLDSTPLLKASELDLSQFRFQDPAQVTGELLAPLRSDLGRVEVQGLLDLPGNRFTELKSGVQLNALKGQLQYDREGMSASGLAANYRDHGVSLRLRSVWDEAEVFHASMNGDFPVSVVLPERVIKAEPLLERITGSSHWSIDLSVTRPDQSGDAETWLDMRSDLLGVTVDFPVPLNKPADQAMDLKVRYPVKSADPVLSVVLQDQATMQFELGEDLGAPLRANIHFGSEFGTLPAAGQIGLDGSVRQFDMDGWMDVVIDRFNRVQAGQGLEFHQASLLADELYFLNRRFEKVGLDLVYAEGVLNGAINSESMQGNIRYSRSDDGSHTLGAEFERLALPDPIDKGMTMDTDPSTLPEMHLFVREFSYAGLELGETRIEAFPIQNGLRIDSVEAVSAQLNFQARGEWVQDELGSRSDFNIIMTSESLGNLVNMMNVSSVLEGGQTMLRYDAWWPGPPAAFALARLNGEMAINVVDGRIMNADAGAGRVVGLLSLSALPRRLALDFRDVFASGFGFDTAQGTITLENGNAYTDDLVLESTAATMAIMGSSDLVEKQFDYIMVVRPGVSQTLPAIGAVIGGPGGAAAGLALQGLLRKNLGDATEARYTIKGPWTSPIVEPINSISGNQDDSGNE